MNPHLKRRELEIIIDHESEATPTKAAVQQLTARQMGHKTESTDVRGIYTESGSAKSRAKVFVWSEKKVQDLSKPKEAAEKKKEAKGAPQTEGQEEVKGENQQN